MLLCYSEALKALDGGAAAATLEVRPEVAAYLAANRAFGDGIREKFPRAKVYVVPDCSKKSREYFCRAERKGFTPPDGAIKI